MPTTITTLSLLQRVDLILNENYGTPAWVLGTEASATPTLTANAGLTRLMNDEVDYLCRRVFALSATFSATYAAASWNERYDAFTVGTDGTSGSTTLTGAKLWWPRAASINGVQLTFCGEDSLKIEDGNYQNTPGQPAYWYRREARYVGVYPVPLASQSVAVDGLYVPAEMTADGTGGLDWCDLDLAQMIVDGTAIRAMIKVTDSPALIQRMGPITERYNTNAMQLWSEIPANLRGEGDQRSDAPYKVPPVAVGGK